MVPHFSDETYEDVKTPGYKVRGRIIRGLNVREHKVRGHIIPVPVRLSDNVILILDFLFQHSSFKKV
jgi:hypothetical protein